MEQFLIGSKLENIYPLQKTFFQGMPTYARMSDQRATIKKTKVKLKRKMKWLGSLVVNARILNNLLLLHFCSKSPHDERPFLILNLVKCLNNTYAHFAVFRTK